MLRNSAYFVKECEINMKKDQGDEKVRLIKNRSEEAWGTREIIAKKGHFFLPGDLQLPGQRTKQSQLDDVHHIKG